MIAHVARLRWVLSEVLSEWVSRSVTLRNARAAAPHERYDFSGLRAELHARIDREFCGASRETRQGLEWALAGMVACIDIDIMRERLPLSECLR